MEKTNKLLDNLHETFEYDPNFMGSFGLDGKLTKPRRLTHKINKNEYIKYKKYKNKLKNSVSS